MTKQIKCGDEVTMKLGKITGMVTAKLNRFKDVQFEITFINNSEHSTIWLHQEEIEKKIEKKIGYK